MDCNQHHEQTKFTRLVRSEQIVVRSGETVADGAHRYSVFVTKSGKRTVVVVNQERDRNIIADVQLPNPGRLVVATPESPDAQPTSGTLKIPPRSAAVVMEQ